MQDILHEPLLTWALRAFLALLFATTALSKLQNLEEFYGVVRNFRVIPDGASRVVAFVLPIVELAVAAGLLIRPLTIPAAITGAAMLIGFGVVIAINVIRGRTSIDCGCMRQGMKQPISWVLVLRNAVLALSALGIVQLLPVANVAGPADLFVGLAAGAIAMMLYFSASLLGGLTAQQSANRSSKGR